MAIVPMLRNLALITRNSLTESPADAMPLIKSIRLKASFTIYTSYKYPRVHIIIPS